MITCKLPAERCSFQRSNLDETIDIINVECLNLLRNYLKLRND